MNFAGIGVRSIFPEFMLRLQYLRFTKGRTSYYHPVHMLRKTHTIFEPHRKNIRDEVVRFSFARMKVCSNWVVEPQIGAPATRNSKDIEKAPYIFIRNDQFFMGQQR